MRKTLVLMALAGAQWCAAPLLAAPPSFGDGVRLYAAHKYPEALAQLSSAEKQAPADPLVHYYLGLCYQGMNQMSQARQQFQWVANCNDPRLKVQAGHALENLSHYSTTYTGAPMQTAQAKVSARFRGRLKVYDFTASWCKPCQRFRPMWESVSAHLNNKAQFSSIDVDDPGNADLVRRFQVQAYPTVVFSDDSGQMLKRAVGAYSDESQFTAEINSFFDNN